jgi:hypothetical protein
MSADINADDKLIVCTYGAKDTAGVQVHVSWKTLMRFRLFYDINADCPSEDGSFFANIPIINDSKNVPIYFTKVELELFFALAAKDQLTVQDLQEITISTELLTRFLILVNFLNYDDYLHTLCQYTALLIMEGNYKI